MAMAEEEIKQEETKQEEPTQSTTPKKRKKWPWVVGILAVLGVIVLIPLIIFTFMGIMPGFSNWFGFNKPVDLGVKWSAADWASYQQKTGGNFIDFTSAPLNPENNTKKTVFADPKQMDVNLTQEEITAAINSSGWLWMPIKNAQVKFNNGQVEVSGNINTAYIPNFVNFIGGVGYSQADVEQATSWAKLLGEPPIYIKANASVTNNIPSLQIVEAKVSRFSIPVDIANKVIQTGTNNAIPRTSGLDIQKATFSDGQLNFTGTTPTTVYVKKN
jgi:hypothetical protein